MLINNLFKLIFISLSFALSITFLSILLLYFYYANNNSFHLNDNNKYIANFVSWYFHIDISFDRLTIIKNDKHNNLAVEVKNFKTTNFNNFDYLSSDLINFECLLLECIKGYKHFQNVSMFKPNIKYTFSNDTNLKKINENDVLNVIDNLKIKNINDGNIILDYKGNISKLLKINYDIQGTHNNNIFGKFDYKQFDKNNTTKISFEIINGKNIKNVNIQFEKLNLSNFNKKIYPYFPQFIRDNDINGEIRFSIEQQMFQISSFKIYSSKGQFLLNQNYSKYFPIDSYYNYKNFILRGYYNFQNKNFKIHDLSFVLSNSDDLSMNFKIDGDTNLIDKSNLDVELYFNNYLLNKLVIFEEFDINIPVDNKLNGTLSFNLFNGKVEDLNGYIKDIYFDSTVISDIKFKRKNLFSNSEINFYITGNANNIVALLKKNSIFDSSVLQTIDGDLDAKINLIIPSVDGYNKKYKYAIQGNIRDVKLENKFIKESFDEDNLYSITFNINNHSSIESINIKNLRLQFVTEGYESFIELFGDYNYFKNKHNMNAEILFNDINLINFNSEYFELKSLQLFNSLSGSSKFKIKDSVLNEINILLDKIVISESTINNFTFKYNNKENISKILFNFIGDINNAANILSNFDYNNEYEHLELDKYNGHINSLVKIKLGNLQLLDIELEGKIKNLKKSSSENLINFINIKLIDEINFHLTKTNNDLIFTGVTKIGQKDVQLNYSKKDNKKIFYTNFLMDDNFRKLFNFKNNIITGDSNYDIKIFNDDDKLNFKIKVDYTDANILLEQVGYSKPFNQQSNLYLFGTLNNKFEPNEVTIKYKDVLNNIHASINNINNKKFDIELMKFIFDKNKFSADIFYDNGNYFIDINGETINLDTFFNLKGKNKNIKNVLINASVDKLILFNEIELNESVILYEYKNRILNNFSIDSKYYGNEDISFNAESDLNNTNRNKYSFVASDAGKFFKTLDFKTEINEGIFSSEGYFGKLDDDYNIMGTISIDNFRIMKTPIFAELLLAASLTGLFELLENDGIEFDQFDAQFFGKDGIYKLSKSRAYGLSLGITAEGTINTNNDSLNIKGALIPAYKINTVFNNIPILGDIISGKEDEGLFAINYLTRGNWDNLQSEINPISALTPGLLRNIFDFLD